MHLMMIVFLVSLGAMLLAAGGVARHIWLQRSQLRGNRQAGGLSKKAPSVVPDTIRDVNEIDPETEL
jgi:hypothetical protein